MAKSGGQAALYIFLLCVLHPVTGQIRYTIPEEAEQGTFVGNIAEDLRLNTRTLSARELRLVSYDSEEYLEVNLDTGILFVHQRINREEICGQSVPCSLSFEVMVESPLEIHRVEVEVLDINDNSPSFPKNELALQIGESIAPGARFPLESAHDPDVGTNAIKTYQISSNDYFGINVQSRSDGSKRAELLLEKPLDREQESTLKLVLTAVDGGVPPRSGTTRVIITVLDANDNAPVFDHEIYRVSLAENASKNAFVIRVKATDSDEGLNAEVKYSFINHLPYGVNDLFSLDSQTGEIRVQGSLDFEQSHVYELEVQAVDKGTPALAGHCKVLVAIVDVNDNAPEVKLTSVSSTVRENASPGTVICLISVTDRDSGKNGQVHCQIPNNIPFKLQKSLADQYKLITSDKLDRETNPTYNISLSAWDSGTPQLSTHRTIWVSVSDVNDNAPRFAQSVYTVYLKENNAPGASIFAVTAVDLDLDQNSYISYSMLENQIQGKYASFHVSVNSNNGNIYALHSFDYEELKRFQIQIQARDSGVPPLSSSVAINVIILDQNDNKPVVISPLTWNGSAAVEVLPGAASPDYLVTKILATDADSGQNARLSYHLLQATDASLFRVGLHSGEIRTTRSFLGPDSNPQSLVIEVTDNGQPSLSTSVTVLVSTGPNVTEKYSDKRQVDPKPDTTFHLNLYLIVILGSTSFIFLIIIVLLIVIKCHQDRHTGYGCNSTFCCWEKRNLRNVSHGRATPKESLHSTEVGERLPIPAAYNYRVSLSPESAKSDFLFLRTYNQEIHSSSVTDTNVTKQYCQ